MKHRFHALRIANHSPADKPHQAISQQNIAFPEEECVNETEQHQQRQARLDPALAAWQQHLQPGTKENGKQREKFYLRKKVEQRPCPGIMQGDVAIPGGIEIGRLRQTKGGDIEQQNAKDGEATDKIERDAPSHVGGSCNQLVWRTARRNSWRVFWLDLNRPPSEVVVVALVASRIPRAFTQ